VKARSILGIVAGVVLLLSSAAHMLLGWPAIHDQLDTQGVPDELVQGLHAGWQFAGAAMIAFGVIVLWTFGRRLRSEPASLLPPAMIAAMYVVFGVWAELISGGEPFFLFVFVIPGLLLAVASVPPRGVV
jgi:hypothetical protein